MRQNEYLVDSVHGYFTGMQRHVDRRQIVNQAWAMLNSSMAYAQVYLSFSTLSAVVWFAAAYDYEHGRNK